MTGKTLAHYEIIARIGQGGMGEVYRARDTKLGREVAIKVLAQGALGRDDALARFEQEARAVAALAHPNIVALYELGTAESDGESIVYAATELLEGRTLRDHLVEGPLPIRKAIETTTQICRGLSAAHEKGIVHRDIKPENLFVTRDGQVKILDFGLARTVPDVGEDDATLRMSKGVDTAPGTVMGTVGYMSPEQVRAEPIDHTSDIFSLGTVLYEMLSGRRAFERDTSAETMTAILREDPPELRAANASVPPGLDWIVRRCLEKNRHERFQSAHDLGLALQSVSTTSFSAAELPADRATSAGGGGRTRALAWGAGVVVAAALGVLGGRAIFGGGGGEATPATVERISFERERVYAARFTGDGNTFVYSAAVAGAPVQIFTAQVGMPGSRSLEFPPSTSLLSVARSGELAVLLGSRQLAHFLRVGTLARAPLAGGAPREMLDDVMEFDWAPNGTDYAVVRVVGNLIRLEFPAGHTILETPNWIGQIRVSPDGNRVAFLRHDLNRFDDGGLVVVADRDGHTRDLTNLYWSSQGIAWSPAGDEVYFCSGDEQRLLRAVDMSGHVRNIARVFGDLTVRDVAADGRILITRDDLRRGITQLDIATGVETDRSWLDQASGSVVSRDGQWLLFSEERIGSSSSTTVVIRKLDGSLPTVLGAGWAFDLSPDGREAVAYVDKPSSLVVLPTGAGPTRTLSLGGVAAGVAAGYTPDGKSIVFSGIEADGGARLFVYDRTSEAVKPISPVGICSDGSYWHLVVSPDSKRVVAVDRNGDTMWLCNLDGSDPVRVESAEAGETPLVWSADGRAIYVAHLRLDRARVFRIDVATGERTLWREIVPTDPAGMEIYCVLMTPDATTLLYGYKRLTSDLFVVDGWR